jgi:hypothetical protein
MKDGTNQTPKEEEYKFPADEFIQGESTGSPSIETNAALEQQAKSAHHEKIMKIYKRIRELLENRMVAIVIAVIILLLCVHFFMTGSTKKVVPVTVQQPVIQQIAPVQQPNLEVMSQLSGMAQSASSMHDTVANLQTQLQTLQSSVEQVSQTNQQYQSVLIDLSKKINDLQDVQNKLLAEQVKQPVKAKSNVFQIPPVDFYTRAVVRNRAWVMGSDGENASIAVGDSLKGYGKVISIDANTGTINTSSGRVINYAPEDR